MYLKDRHGSDTRTGFGGPHVKKKKVPCKRFNRGKCHEGASCKYDHRCTVPECGKFGHGAHICRKRKSVSSTAATGTEATSSSSK